MGNFQNTGCSAAVVNEWIFLKHGIIEVANLLTAGATLMNALAVFSVLLQYNRIYAVIQAIITFLYNCYRVYAVIL